MSIDLSQVRQLAGAPPPMQSANIDKLAEALAKAQGAFRPAKKDRTNDFYRQDYATLDAVAEAIREPLSKNGLSYLQPCDGKSLYTILLHASGQWIRSGDYDITPMRQKGGGWEAARDPQAIGSAITYAKRQSLCAFLGVVADEDDDAEEALPREPEEVRGRATKGIEAARAAIAGAKTAAAFKVVLNRLSKSPKEVREAVEEDALAKQTELAKGEWVDPGPPPETPT